MSVKKAKEKIAKKIAKGKSKVAKKCGRCAALLIALTVLAGCQNPAQRAQTCEVNIYAYDASRVTLGTESVTLAQSNETGGNDAGQTATPTNDIKPDVDVTVGGMGGGSDPVSAVAGAVKSVAGACKSSGSSDCKDCTDGKCGDCTDGKCGD